MVGIGASAGGINALREFFGRMPPDTGMAFVVILHLSEDHESNLAEILQSQTAMPVSQVNETVRVEPNHVYVIPPAKNLALVDGEIRLTEPSRVRGVRVSIDLLFRTLADAYGKNGIGVILSGTGSDGALGLKRVKESGGFAFAQDPSDAEYDGMPKSAVATGLVDLVLPVAAIPAKLAALKRRSDGFQLPAKGGEVGVEEEVALREVFTLLRVATGHDFSSYKRPTVLRRVARRLQVHELKSMVEYPEFLRQHPQELRGLLSDLLITVTNFFRDPRAFAALQAEVLPSLFQGKTGADTVRVWVAGCATGEEAYSLAILLREYAASLSDPPGLQIFASDINEAAIAIAREGRFEENIVADVSPERLRQFFVREGTRYRVKTELREIVLFAPHNLLRDPPFSKLDLITCRNLLIYLNHLTHERLLELFHFALRPGGFLFLGSSEFADTQTRLFTPVDKRHRLYRSRKTVSASLPSLPSPGQWQQVWLPETAAPNLMQKPSYGDWHLSLLEALAPPSVLVNEDFEIVHLSENAGKYLFFGGGEPSRNLLKVVRPELRLDLSAVLMTAKQEGRASEIRNVHLGIGDGQRSLNLSAHPAALSETSRFFLVLFGEGGVIPEGGSSLAAAVEEPAVGSMVRHLETELKLTQDRLRSMVEQYETSTEEFKAANEELQAINEELHSASEELETSKEELQSLNEELITVNQELKDKVEEIGRVNSDLQNLISSTDIATVFLDCDLSIKRFTPRAQELFNVIASDVGRPLDHLTHRLEYPSLIEDVMGVLESLHPVEREVRSTDGSWYIARMLPYRILEDKVDGVVLNFLDITERKRIELAYQQTQERLRLLIESTDDYAIFTTTQEGLINFWNPGAERIFGYHEAEILGQHMAILFTPEDRERGLPEQEMRIATAESRASDERYHLRKDGKRFYASGVLTPLLAGAQHGFAKIARDLTARKQMEEDLHQADRRKDEFLATLAHELRNPLAPLYSGLEILRLEKRANGEVLGMLSRQVEQLVRLVDDLLDISRITQGKIRLRPERIELKTLMEWAVEASRSPRGERLQKLMVSLPPQPLVIEADGARIAQVLSNLLTNASRFSPPGAEIWLSGEREGSQGVIRVRDQGRGIPPEMLSKVFEMFTQVEDPSGTAQGGLGIGLSLVKGLVELHGGTVQAKSGGLGQGSEFSVCLPLAQSRTPPPKPVKARKEKKTLTKGKRVLVVDDYESGRNTLGRLLRMMGYQVLLAEDGPSGLQAAAEFRPEVVLMDINMPGMSGLEVARRLRGTPEFSATRLVALSGYGQEEDFKRSREAGFDFHLTKPVGMEALEELLNKEAEG